MSRIPLLLPMGKLCRGALEGTEGVEGNKATKGKRSRNKGTARFSVPHPGPSYQ